MEKQHRDIHGKIIHMNDVVTIHKAKEYWYDFSAGPRHFLSDGKIDYSKQLFGNIGVVVGFGCVTIETNALRKDIIRYQTDSITSYYFNPNEVEVIGKL
jgi:uncharacterized membrane protein